MTVRTESDVQVLLQRTKALAQLSRDLIEASQTAIERSALRVAASRRLLANERFQPMHSVGTIVVIGGSAGSLGPLRLIVRKLPLDTAAAVFIVQHTSQNYWRMNGPLGALTEWTHLPTDFARDGRRFEAGHVYLCPSDHHLSFANGTMKLEQSPKENLTRPSIDVLFRSAAAEFGRNVIGVLLSGALRDGVAGLWQIKRRGGTILVQDPSDAQFPGIPNQAITNTDVDYVLAGEGLAGKLAGLLSARRETDDDAVKQVAVMIVEDERLVAGILAEQLHQLGYQISSTVRTGEEAISRAAETMPHVILMDIRLASAMTGVEAARRIWEKLQIPVVFVTGDADAPTLDDIKSTVNYGYVMKPFQTRAIHAAIELALDRRQSELMRPSV